MMGWGWTFKKGTKIGIGAPPGILDDDSGVKEWTINNYSGVLQVLFEDGRMHLYPPGHGWTVIHLPAEEVTATPQAA